MRIAERIRREEQKRLGIPKWNGPRNPIKKRIIETANFAPLAETRGRKSKHPDSNLVQMEQFVRRRKKIQGPITAIAGAKSSAGYQWFLFDKLVPISEAAREVIIFYE